MDIVILYTLYFKQDKIGAALCLHRDEGSVNVRYKLSVSMSKYL